MARCLASGSRLGPLGTAQDLSVPSTSSRKIVMQPRGIVTLYAEEISRGCLPSIRPRRGFGRLIEGSLAAVFFQRHSRRTASILRAVSQYTSGEMWKRFASLVAVLLAVLFLGPSVELVALAAAQTQSSPCSCCKDSSCCRRSHHTSNGPALAATPACGQACHVGVQNFTRLTATAPPVTNPASLYVASSSPAIHRSQSYRTCTDRSLYQRPPPSVT